MTVFGAIPIFVAVVKGGGFSSAARTLGVSKSAVSKRINQLEQDLGVRLLYRSTRKLSLTEAGVRYFEYAEQALLAANRAEDAVAEMQGEPQGKLKISSPMSFGRLCIAPLIPKILRCYPKLEIDLLMDDSPVDLVSEGIDIAIRSSFGELPDSALVARKLAPLRQAVFASSSYEQEYLLPQTPADLVEHNCILFSYSRDANVWTFERNGEYETVEVTGTYRVNNSEAILTSIVDGIGVGRMPTFVAAPFLRTGQLIKLLPQYRIPEHTLYAVFPERKYLPAKVRVFLEFAMEHFGGDEPYWDA